VWKSQHQTATSYTSLGKDDVFLLAPLMKHAVVCQHSERKDGLPAKYTNLHLPFGVMGVPAQLRIGWAHLEAEQGRKRHLKVPREARLCRSGKDATLAWRQAVPARLGLVRMLRT
jgi:hypothetical protein